MLGMSDSHYSQFLQHRFYLRTRFLIPCPDIHFHHPGMSTARPKRNCAQVNYVEPTELDDDIAVEDDAVEVEAAAEPIDDQSPDSDSDSSDSEPDADEFTTDKVSTERMRSNPASNM